MAVPIKSRGNWNAVQSLGGEVIVIGLRFTTDGSADETLADNYGGLVSIARSTNTYTITLPGSVGKIYSVVVGHALTATVNCTPSFTTTAGTVALAFSGAIASNTVDVTIIASATYRGATA